MGNTAMRGAVCESCQVARINGVLCHEHGCPDAWRTERRECRWCGSAFAPEQRWERECCECCAAAYRGGECSCELCQQQDTSSPLPDDVDLMD